MFGLLVVCVIGCGMRCWISLFVVKYVVIIGVRNRFGFCCVWLVVIVIFNCVLLSIWNLMCGGGVSIGCCLRLLLSLSVRCISWCCWSFYVLCSGRCVYCFCFMGVVGSIVSVMDVMCVIIVNVLVVRVVGMSCMFSWF